MTMHHRHIKVQVKIEPGEATPAQAAAWRATWAKLLSKGPKQITDNEAEKGAK